VEAARSPPRPSLRSRDRGISPFPDDTPTFIHKGENSFPLKPFFCPLVLLVASVLIYAFVFLLKWRRRVLPPRPERIRIVYLPA